MAKTISNVLVGVATLYVRQPNDAIAEWSTAQYQAGSHSVKLYKNGTGNDGSTHLQITPPTGITMQNFTDAVTDNSFYHYSSGGVANYAQFEFRFEDPDSEAWAEITAVPLQGHDGDDGWEQLTLADDSPCGYGGHTEIDTSFFVWGALVNANQVMAAITALDGTACAPEDWILTRVRLELWEAAPARTCYIDTVEIMGTTYAIEPGGDAPAISLSSPFEEVGYTEDGVTMEYTVEATDIMVHEETFPIDSAITKESITVTCNMAEASLTNMNNAMAGAVLSGSIITLGDGVNKTMNLKIEGTSPAGYLRAIQIPKAVASGTVGMSYKKGEKTIIPVSFKAIKTDNSACTIVDNAA